MSIEERDWVMRAACKDYDPDIFFPTRGESVEPARRICGGCPVREECLEYALRSSLTLGIWGGLSERERRRLRHRSYI